MFPIPTHSGYDISKRNVIINPASYLLIFKDTLHTVRKEQIKIYVLRNLSPVKIYERLMQ